MGIFSKKKKKDKIDLSDKSKENKTSKRNRKVEHGLHKTKESLGKKLLKVFGRNNIDYDFYDELEEVLVDADIGIETTLEIITKLKDGVKKQKLSSHKELIEYFKSIVIDSIKTPIFDIDEDALHIIFVVGVNGVGKTTAIAKLANLFKSDNKKVLIAACDTFRAAAIDQLSEWASRINVNIVKKEHGSDAGSVLHQALDQSISKKVQILIVDTAGRLHNKQNLMKEIEKLNRIIDRKSSEIKINKENMLVIDANTGQNAYKQAQDFHSIIEIDSIFLAKLDSTSKGGIIIPITHNLNIPIKYCGLGEKIDEIIPFDKYEYIETIIGTLD